MLLVPGHQLRVLEDIGDAIREQAPTLTPALLIEEGEGAVSIPSPPEGERVRVRGV